MKVKNGIGLISAIAFLVSALFLAADNMGQAQALSSAEQNFEFLWQSSDQIYALFSAKHVDWQALYNIYRPAVTAKTSDDELFAVLSKMLGHLNDNHVRLTSTNPDRSFGAGYLYDFFGQAGMTKMRAMMRSRPVPDKYFQAPLHESANKIFAHGWLDDGIGYFHFRGFGDPVGTAKAIDEIIADFKGARAVIVDVRRNGGGDDQVGKLIAGRFADKKRLYMTTQERNGSRHDDFDPKKYFFVEPAGPQQFTKTVILLTNRLSVSAAENFTLAMRILPHVTVVGDFTSGCFADNYLVKLPNGWNLSLSKNLFLDCHGFCWEGIGVPPDIKVSCRYDDAVSESDPVLETALALIRSGNLSYQDESEGLRPTQSLAAILAREIETDGIDKAIGRFHERRDNDAAGDYYVDYYELTSLAKKLFAAGQAEKGEQVFGLIARLFPEVSAVYDNLGLEYLKQDRKSEARLSFEKAAAMKLQRIKPLARQFAEYLADTLIAEWLSKDFSALSRRYEALKVQYPIQVNENLLNGLGYLFLNNGLFDRAIQVLQLNVEKFPVSANAYDSLGEAYMNAGKRELAIANYEKSLKLNPDNSGGTENMKKLKEQKQAP